MKKLAPEAEASLWKWVAAGFASIVLALISSVVTAQSFEDRVDALEHRTTRIEEKQEAIAESLIRIEGTLLQVAGVLMQNAQRATQ